MAKAVKVPAQVPSNREELLYEFGLIAKRVQKQNKDIEVADFANVLLPDLVKAVPNAAFDPVQPWDEGILFYGGEIADEVVVDLQHDLMRAHLNLPPDLPITVNLSSGGGDVYAGLSAASTVFELQRQGRIVNIHVGGWAASMASVFLQAGNYRTMEATAHLLLHKVSYRMSGSSDEHEEQWRASDRLNETLYRLYGSRSGKPISYYATKMRKSEWSLTATEALEEGLVDEVIQPPKYPLPNVSTSKLTPKTLTTKKRAAK
jgi:ATP-dependent protease ClpP protease subunit